VYAPFGEIIEATDGGGSSAGIEKHRRRMNDKFVDEIGGLAYYGFRYYDKTSMTWTQSDPLYRFAPDAAWDAPRRGALYTNDLNNPLRYLDPDGRSPAAVARKIGEKIAARGAAAAEFGPFAGVALTVLTVYDVVDTGIYIYRRWRGPTPQPPPNPNIPTPDEPTGPTTTTVPQEPPPPEAARKPKKTDKVKPLPPPPDGYENPPGPGNAPGQDEIPPGRVIPPKKKPKNQAGSSAANPANASSGAEKTSEQHNRPADQNGDGKVTDSEESEWMRSIQ